MWLAGPVGPYLYVICTWPSWREVSVHSEAAAVRLVDM
jgi:hypothetical protein